MLSQCDGFEGSEKTQQIFPGGLWWDRPPLWVDRHGPIHGEPLSVPLLPPAAEYSNLNTSSVKGAIFILL